MERGPTRRQKRHRPNHDIHKSVATVGTSLRIKSNPTLARHATHQSSPKGLDKAESVLCWAPPTQQPRACQKPHHRALARVGLCRAPMASPAACVVRVLPVQPPLTVESVHKSAFVGLGVEERGR
jgi:hypothetical protein